MEEEIMDRDSESDSEVDGESETVVVKLSLGHTVTVTANSVSDVLGRVEGLGYVLREPVLYFPEDFRSRNPRWNVLHALEPTEEAWNAFPNFGLAFVNVIAEQPTHKDRQLGR